MYGFTKQKNNYCDLILHINNSIVERVYDLYLDWSSHINAVSKKIYRTVGI